MKVLVTGDWHLGAETWRRKPQDRTHEIQQCLNEILEFLENDPIDLIAVTGDLTDYWLPLESERQRWLMDYLYMLSEHAPVVGVLGNHDWRGLASIDRFARQKGVYIVDKSGTVELSVKSRKVCAVCLPYFDARRVVKASADSDISRSMDRGKQFMQNFFREDPCQQDADYKILIAHGVVEGLAYSGLSVNDVPIPLDALGLFDFAFLGHIHDAQLITERGSGRVVGCYPGGVAKLDFGEEKSKQGFWIVDLDSKPVTPEFHTFVHQKPLTTIVFQNKPSVEEIRNLENVSGFVRIILKEGDLVTVQHLYDLPPVVSVELEPKEPIEEGARHQTFSSMEEAFAKYVDLQKVDDPLKARLVETFSYYMSKVKDNEEQA